MLQFQKVPTISAPVFQLNTTYTTNNYHYNADVTNLETDNKKASTCTTRASILVIYIYADRNVRP